MPLRGNFQLQGTMHQRLLKTTEQRSHLLSSRLLILPRYYYLLLANGSHYSIPLSIADFLIPWIIAALFLILRIALLKLIRSCP